ncbi:MAG: hypothetical protein R3D52_15300 [Xanthobacteraceae bacterium]
MPFDPGEVPTRSSMPPGSGSDPNGPEANRAATMRYRWARGSISATMTHDGAGAPRRPARTLFGDTRASNGRTGRGLRRAGQKERTGAGSELSTYRFALVDRDVVCTRLICQSTGDKLRFPRPEVMVPFNPLVANYQTDGQLPRALHRTGQTDGAGSAKLRVGRTWQTTRAMPHRCRQAPREYRCLQADMKALFASKTLAEWREILAKQDSQWDVVQEVGGSPRRAGAGEPLPATGRLRRRHDDPDGCSADALRRRSLHAPLADLGADGDAILTRLGYDEDAVIDLKVKGVVF